VPHRIPHHPRSHERHEVALVIPSGDDPKKPSAARVGIWIVVGAVGVYFLANGIIGIVTSGG
jgi:hypothetical protein